MGIVSSLLHLASKTKLRRRNVDCRASLIILNSPLIRLAENIAETCIKIRILSRSSYNSFFYLYFYNIIITTNWSIKHRKTLISLPFHFVIKFPKSWADKIPTFLPKKRFFPFRYHRYWTQNNIPVNFKKGKICNVNYFISRYRRLI